MYIHHWFKFKTPYWRTFDIPIRTVCGDSHLSTILCRVPYVRRGQICVVETFDNYYFANHSLLYGLKGFHGTDEAAIIENIIYLELRRRGFKVYVGKLYDQEIDFDAEKEKGRERLYVQVCKTMPSSSDRECLILGRLGTITRSSGHSVHYKGFEY